MKRALATKKPTRAPSARFLDLLRRARRLPKTPQALLKSIVDSGDSKLFGLNGPALRQLARLRHTPGIKRHLIGFDERSHLEREKKIGYLSNIIGTQRIDRVRHFRELIRLERLRGNDLVAATYGLRILRWLGHDKFRLLGSIQDALREHGYVREAETAEAMYGYPERAQECSRALLDNQLNANRSNPERPFEAMLDRRKRDSFRVSIIVSLYNAAEKLPTFWHMLQQQDVVRSGEAEVVFIDSGSPGNEYAVFQSLSEQSPISAVFARSKDRETIQTAWNRGINLSKGAYLAFLGVDEGLHPECLAILARELDQNASVEWVMADSIVTEVDREGIFSRDVMPYDRTGYRHDWHYLDCTFLSYVGGLYRRTIHDRLGYYDESFRAAGDTEFKNRILPHIKTKYVPQVLGVFNNYPEERTTQHPRAEIEDLRAWYLHRTPAGVSYAFDQRPAQDAVMLLQDAFAYRKCYCEHISTDIDLAYSLATYLAIRQDAGSWREAHGPVREMLQTFQGFELLERARNPLLDQLKFVRDYRKILRLSEDLSRKLGFERAPAFDVFHDNRYEQHWWSWS